MRHRSRAVAALILAPCAPALAAASTPVALFEVGATVTGLRSARGQVLACLTRSPARFPDCEDDPDARKLIVPAGANVELSFGAVPPGTYAIALVHDENANGKLDKRLVVPAEGFGFSRNAPVRLGPPSFASAAFPVRDRDQHLSIRMRYLF